MRYLTVHRGPYYRGPYTIKRGGRVIRIPRHRVRAHLARMPDRGRPGRGEKVIPELKKGALTRIANEMGYKRVTEIPDRKLETFIDRCVKRYGARRTFGRIHAQIILRLHAKNPDVIADRRKFEKMRDILTEKYSWEKVNGWRTVKKQS